MQPLMLKTIQSSSAAQGRAQAEILKESPG